MVLAARYEGGLVDARPLLELAVRGDPAAAYGFGASLDTLTAIDPRLPQSILRCAFVGSIRAHVKRYDSSAEENQARRRRLAEQRRAGVEAELRWLRGESDEPVWPDFPDDPVLVRERLHVGGAPATARHPARRWERAFYADHQAAAIWLSKFRNFVASVWLRVVTHHYRDWTSRMNGLGLPVDEELSQSAHKWNDAYFRLVARSLSGLDADAIDRLCLTAILSLPDAPFLVVTADFLLPLDVVYFEDKGVAVTDVVRIRTKLAERLQQTSSWQRFARKPGYGIEHHLDLALGALFLTQHTASERRHNATSRPLAVPASPHCCRSSPLSPSPHRACSSPWRR